MQTGENLSIRAPDAEQRRVPSDLGSPVVGPLPLELPAIAPAVDPGLERVSRTKDPKSRGVESNHT